MTSPVNTPFVGEVDEVRAWSRAFTFTDVTSTWREAVDPDDAMLAGYWKFNEAKDNVVSDVKGNNLYMADYTWANNAGGEDVTILHRRVILFRQLAHSLIIIIITTRRFLPQCHVEVTQSIVYLLVMPLKQIHKTLVMYSVIFFVNVAC